MIHQEPCADPNSAMKKRERDRKGLNTIIKITKKDSKK